MEDKRMKKLESRSMIGERSVHGHERSSTSCAVRVQRGVHGVRAHAEIEAIASISACARTPCTPRCTRTAHDVEERSWPCTLRSPIILLDSSFFILLSSIRSYSLIRASSPSCPPSDRTP